MAEIIYSKYSNERSRRFAIRTDILEAVSYTHLTLPTTERV